MSHPERTNYTLMPLAPASAPAFDAQTPSSRDAQPNRRPLFKCHVCQYRYYDPIFIRDRDVNANTDVNIDVEAQTKEQSGSNDAPRQPQVWRKWLAWVHDLRLPLRGWDVVMVYALICFPSCVALALAILLVVG